VNEPIARGILTAVESEASREARARDAAELVRSSRAYRWAGIYDVGDGERVLLGESGTSACNQAVRTGTTIAGVARAVVPILGAESGIVIGTLDVESDDAGSFADDGVTFLEDCAAALRPLYD
jgi:putative methionine-R-sulfoxide reductase with GAF domain